MKDKMHKTNTDGVRNNTKNGESLRYKKDSMLHY